MKAIILAAGYGTRLYPLTINTPKCFLKYEDKRIIDYLIEDIKSFVSEVIIVTNDRFYSKFLEFNDCTVISDNSTCNENRFGAGNDMIYTIKKLNIEEECLVIASDNLYSFSLKYFFDFYNKFKISSLMYYKEKDINKLKTTGIVILDRSVVTNFYEKPEGFISHFAVPPAYIFNYNAVRKLNDMKYGNYDSPGLLIEELIKSVSVKAYKMKGFRIDLGH